MKTTWVKLWLLSIAAIMVLSGYAEGSQPPELSIPLIRQKPVIDGKIEHNEWQDANSLTGVCNLGYEGRPGGLSCVVPEIQQVDWHIGYDKDALYIAMHSTFPKGTLPKARVKPGLTTEEIGNRILFDDHLELQFCPYDRDKAETFGYGFYKVMVNPRGAYTNHHFNNGTPGTEHLWYCGGNVKSHIDLEKGIWDVEMAIPFKNFGHDVPIDKPWIIQLVRTDFCGGIYFAGLVGSSWKGWDKFAGVYFDENVPVVKLKKIGEISKGDLDMRFTFKGVPKQKATILTDVSVVDAEGKTIFSKSQKTVVPPNETKEIAFTKKGLPLSAAKGERDKEQQNFLKINCRMLDTVKDRKGVSKEKEKKLYCIDIPIIKMTNSYWNTYIGPWIKNRPAKVEWDYRIAYYPYYRKLKAIVDTDLLGVEKQVAQANSFKLTVNDKSGKKIAEKTAAMKDGYGECVIDLPELEGNYEVVCDIMQNGRKLSTKTQKFVRKKYPWEHNTIGMDDLIIPPYDPIKLQGKELKVWGREYTIGKTGLPEKIMAGKTGYVWYGGAEKKRKNLLRSPVVIESVQDKTKHVLTSSKDFKVTDRKDARVKLKSEGALGDVSVAVESFIEYDGWYQVTLRLKPKQGPVKLESLDMVWPLLKEADTLYVQKVGDMLSGNYFGAIPEGDGVVWESKKLGNIPQVHGTWAPIVYCGTGSRGLWYLAESDQGWMLDDNISAIQVERTKEGPQIRFRLANHPVTLVKERTITFAMIATPVKPLPENWRATAWQQPEGEKMTHDGTGYRYYGESVDSFSLPTEKDYEALRDFLFQSRKKNPDRSYMEKHAVNVRQGVPLVLYGSTQMTGLGMPSFDTFAGEWLGDNNLETTIRNRVDNSFKGKSCYGGTIKWDTPRACTAMRVNFTQSLVDCYVWYHKKLIEKCPVNGTWWDNASVSFGNDVISDMAYVRDDGKVQGKSNVFMRRQLTKRLAVMGYQAARKPLYIMNMHVDFPFCQRTWHIENDFGVHSPTATMLDKLTVDIFRALTRTKQGIIPQLHSSLYAADGNPLHMRKQIRNIIGMCLLHDIGERGLQPWRPYQGQIRKRALDAMEKNVGFLRGQAEFVPYWEKRAKKMVTFSTPGVRASVYLKAQWPEWRKRTPEPNRAVIVLLNENREDVLVKDFEVHEKALGLKPRRMFDAETGFEIGREYDRKKRKYFFGEAMPRQLALKGHDYRLIVVEE